MITDLKINEEKKKEYYEKGYWTHDTIARRRRTPTRNTSPTTRTAA